MQYQQKYLRPSSRPSVELVDKLLALTALIVFLPVWLVNVVAALIRRREILNTRHLVDALNRPVETKHWSCGPIKNSFAIIQILIGRLSFCGLSLRQQCDHKKVERIYSSLNPALFSLVDLHETVGYIEMSHLESIRYHERKIGILFNLQLIAKSVVTNILYKASKKQSPNKFELFGISINNVRYSEAVKWICNVKTNRCRTTYFVNVNSFNIAEKNLEFKEVLNQADCVLADGSGVRLGAKTIGVQLKDNINGTDLFPHLCQEMSRSGKSLYLLGAAPGVVDETAKNLKQAFPLLKISGTHHGFFSEKENLDVINKINESGADILLVAMGSPHQELWLQKNKEKLNVQCGLAVGGLFDFYSGNIPRAPRWMRELGFEWIYRLIQEPTAKFERYVIGNPLFLARLFLRYS